MTSANRALLAVVAIGIGLALMAVGYGKQQWMFQVAVVVGVALVLGVGIWWGVAERRATYPELETPQYRKHKT